MSETQRALRVFLCHSSSDKRLVRDLYWRLRSDGLEPWIDEESLLAGQDWNSEIKKAVRCADVVIVCLSNESINKAGFVQKEVKYALDVAEEKPDDTIFLIPLRLEDCKVPERLRRWHWVDLFNEKGYERLMRALRLRAKSAGLILRRNDVVALGQHRPSQLAAAILQVESLLRAELINLNITLEIAVDPRIFVDVPLAVLTHVLANILSNSKEASNAGGTIRIESADAGEAVYCTVTDNGPGIPREILERVLKGVTPSMRQHQGWGLLLSSLMLKANGGAIEFTSTGPSGTCITLALPKFRGNPNLGQVPLEMVVNN